MMGVPWLPHTLDTSDPHRQFFVRGSLAVEAHGLMGPWAHGPMYPWAHGLGQPGRAGGWDGRVGQAGGTGGWDRRAGGKHGHTRHINSSPIHISDQGVSV